MPSAPGPPDLSGLADAPLRPRWLGRLPLGPDLRAYLRFSRTATYSFLAALPLLVGYHVLILAAGNGGRVRVGAEVWITQLLRWLGGTGMLALGVATLLVGLGVLWAERRKSIPIRRRYFGWIVVESLGYAVALAVLIGWLVASIFAAAPVLAPAMQAMGGASGLTLIALSLGAGIYEELVFRVLLVGGLFLALHRLTAWERGRAYVVAAVVGALLFSAVHYIGVFGDPFALGSFTFRFLFGLALNAVFLVRGFGVAAWTHALYDVLVVTLIL